MPPGHAILDRTTGDLDRDADDLLVAQRPLSEDVALEDPSAPAPLRPLLIFVRADRDGALRFAARNDHVVPCRRCGLPGADGHQDGPAIDDATGTFCLASEYGSAERYQRSVCFAPRADGRWYLSTESRHRYRLEDPDAGEEIVVTGPALGDVPFESHRPE